jgi:hypothetical protein
VSCLARYDLDPVALRIYGLIRVAIAIMRTAVWLYVTKPSEVALADTRSLPAARRAGLDR